MTRKASNQPLRFAVGAHVRLTNLGIVGEVGELEERPGPLGEYWHKVKTDKGERKEPGCNLELLTPPLSNPTPREAIRQQERREQPLPREQAIELLETQLAKPAEQVSFNDPSRDSWQRVTLSIVERTFGKPSRHVNDFGWFPNLSAYDDKHNEEAYEKHLATLKAMLRAFIEELRILPPARLPVEVQREGVYFQGQTFDAMSNAARILGSATNSLILIDGYLGDETLSLFPTQPGLTIKVLTRPLTPNLKTLCRAFSAQHGSLEVRSSVAFHDRFVLIDNSTCYHVGASVKDLGKKAFMFSKIEESEIIAAIGSKFVSEWATALGEI